MRFKIKDDIIVSMAVVPSLAEIDSDEEAAAQGGPEILVVSDGGMGKRSFVSRYRKTRRGAKGVVSMRLKQGEKVVAALLVDDTRELMITTYGGNIVRIPVSEIRTVGRASVGVRIMRFKGDDNIAGVTCVEQSPVTDDQPPTPDEGADSAPESMEETIPQAPVQENHAAEVPEENVTSPADMEAPETDKPAKKELPAEKPEEDAKEEDDGLTQTNLF